MADSPVPNSSAGTRRLLDGSLFQFVLFFGTTLLLYFPSFFSTWTLDDYVVIVQNPDVQSIAGFLQDSYPVRPLREITYLLDHAVFGMNPAGWHVQNIFWHSLCAFLLFRLAEVLTRSRFLAVVAAALFLAHPLNVEVVANLAHRKDSLSLAFMLFALLAYVRVFAEAHSRWRWLALTAFCWVLALLAKENAMLLPVILVAYEFAAVPAGQRILARYPRGVAAIAGAGVSGAFAWYFFLGGMAEQLKVVPGIMAKVNKSFAGSSLEPYYLMMFKAWGLMFGKLFRPTDLSPEYTFVQPAGWTEPAVLAGVASVPISAGLAWWALSKRKPLVIFCLVWFWMLWLPVSNLWPFSYFAADRYLYAPMVGLCLLLPWALHQYCPRRYVVIAVCSISILGMFMLSWRQVPVWRDNLSLWSQAARVNPTSTVALVNLALVKQQAGDLDGALELFERAAQNFNNPLPYYHLGKLLLLKGEPERAVQYLHKFQLFNDPSYPREMMETRKLLQLHRAR